MPTMTLFSLGVLTLIAFTLKPIGPWALRIGGWLLVLLALFDIDDRGINPGAVALVLVGVGFWMAGRKWKHHRKIRRAERLHQVFAPPAPPPKPLPRGPVHPTLDRRRHSNEAIHERRCAQHREGGR